MPDDSGLRRDAKITQDGHAEYQEWVAGSRGQRENARVQELTGRFASNLLGSVVDHVNQRLVIVVDPAAGDTRADLRQRIAQERLALQVDVEIGCRSKEHLDNIKDSLRSDSASRYLGTPYSFYTDPGTGTVHVLVEDGPVAEDIRSRFGESVRVLEANIAPLQGGRTNDYSAHYGDAQINLCTSNFTYTNALTARVMVTAGHCNLGSSAPSFYSGANYVGSGSSRLYGNGRDMQLVWGSDQTYTNKIYTDPGSPTTRSVTGKITPVEGTFLCAGGRLTLSRCGADVYNAAASVCYSDGACVNGMWARRSATQVPICRPGDSGGVLYQRSGSSSAIAAGMITGGNVDQDGNPVPLFGYHVCFFQAVAQIEAAYGLAVTTSP